MPVKTSPEKNFQMKLILTCIALALLATACTETATPTNTSTPATAGSPAASPAAPAAPGDPLAATRANYAKNCEGCHGPTGDGGLVRVNDKQIKVPSLKAGHALKHTEEQLINIVTNGEEAMPAFKEKLTAAEIAEMVRFVRTEFQGR
jgi:mono/diheme cytochrome c family protein